MNFGQSAAILVIAAFAAAVMAGRTASGRAWFSRVFGEPRGPDGPKADTGSRPKGTAAKPRKPAAARPKPAAKPGSKSAPAPRRAARK